MVEPTLLSSANLRLRASLVDSAVSVPSLVILSVYLFSVLELGRGEWVTFGSVVGVFSLVATVGLEVWRRRMYAPIGRYLDQLHASPSAAEVPPEAVREAFACVVAIPQQIRRRMLIVWLVAVAVLPLAATAAGGEGWLTPSRGGTLFVAGLTGGLVSSVLVFFGYKRLLDPIRSQLATSIPDPDERRSLSRPATLGHKMRYAIVGSGLAALLFSVSLSVGQAGQRVEEMAAEWQGRALSRLGAAVEAVSGPAGSEGDADERTTLELVTSRLFPDEALIPYGASFGLLSPVSGGALDETAARVHALAVEGQVAQGADPQTYRPDQLLWVTLADGRILYSAISREGLRSAVGGASVSILLAMLLSLGLFVLVGYMLSEDVSRTTHALMQSVERMASGDLRRGLIVESEDELGELSRAFEHMGGALRTTVGRVVEAADRVEATAADISAATQGVGIASADQVRQLQQANELMFEINQQVVGVSESAQALNVSVEESSSSILELGAAGDELNDTASVLSTKVEEVGSSIEQMVRSVKQVGSTSEELTQAAAETASSMEEMASAMRAVDNTAEQAAQLSSGVVASAEGGRNKVSQTIEGMQAISDATDSAEGVIRGLGASAKEIGAILDVIDDVADETNLLALNAAIIAAQAGEHGRAFSVVADEIKELADRVLASTKEIGGLIRSVQAESANAVGAIEEGSRSVASGVELSAEAGISLEEITRASRESGTHIGQIVVSVREQTKAASHVVMLMDKVGDAVEQISVARAEQDRGNEVVFRSSLTMRDVAQQVRRTTEEQSRGFGRIRESVEGVREAVEQINSSLSEQSSACEQVGGFLEQVLDSTRSNEESAQQMGGSMRALTQQAQSLREDVARFQI